MPLDVETARAAYAEELRYVSHIKSEEVIRAFATVPRESFLGPRPWYVAGLGGNYWEVPADDPAAAYHNVLFAIDVDRELNNGQPDFWAKLLDNLDIQRGRRLCHIGAGTGYYTGIMAELVGPEGSVIAFEIDPVLAGRAAENLRPWSNVEVIAGDGATTEFGPVDIIAVSAGATHPLPSWLASLKPGGQLLVPLTTESGLGNVFRIDRLEKPDDYRARTVSTVWIYPCAGARSQKNNRLLARALAGGGQRFVRSLRCDTHDRDSTCWLHGDGYCFSIVPAA